MKPANYVGFKDASEWLNFFINSSKCNVEMLIKMAHIKFKGQEPQLPMKMYKFLDGPFKGSLFHCSAPDLKLMNEQPWFEVEFISGPCKGIRTSSLITYDRKIISLEPKWLKLLSNAPHI